MDPRVKPGGDAVCMAGAQSIPANPTAARSLVATPPRLSRRRRSRLGRKAQPSGGLERLDVEGADLDRAAYIEGHGDAVLGHRRGDDARALRQQRGDVRRRASLRLENAIADDADD